jgi:hypothetical protein
VPRWDGPEGPANVPRLSRLAPTAIPRVAVQLERYLSMTSRDHAAAGLSSIGVCRLLAGTFTDVVSLGSPLALRRLRMRRPPVHMKWFSSPVQRVFIFWFHAGDESHEPIPE